MEAEMTDALGAEKGERTAARLGYRSGYYTRTLITRVGKLKQSAGRRKPPKQTKTKPPSDQTPPPPPATPTSPAVTS